jgi:3-hydroxyisobutyrate dehydrogenase-like beta-hydroxyacid dehydrogenase
MAKRLVSRGFPLVVFNRTREKTTELANRGARVAASPAEATDDVDAVITVVADDEALEAVSFGSDGFLSTIRPEATHLEMSTVFSEFHFQQWLRLVRSMLPL